MAALVATSMGVVREVLGDSVVDEVDEPIVDYIANVLADQDFDFGPPDGHGIFDALGELLIDARCVYDQEHCLEVPVHIPPTPTPRISSPFRPLPINWAN
jgi:ATP-binding cassette subfamily F protein 3